MSTADLHTLTGAYVLHALAPDERAEFERHLQVCPSCAQEVRELSATAGRLALAVAVVPPPALKAQVMGRISAERQEAPWVPRQARRGVRGRRGRALSRFALAACIAAAAGFGGVAVWQHGEAQDARDTAQRAQRQSEELASVLAAPDAKASTAKLSDGGRGTVVVSQRRNKAVFLTSGLPKPPQGKVYQLWYSDAGTMRPAGLMDPAATDSAVLMDGPLNAASGMGITVEPAGGSAKPTSDPLALVNFPA
ncbi:anti-sigma factor [Streptomyces sp. NBC_01142]|uniref:anti-sigma factor n=1 Tax=Streptomyces sp. NBC_01142 TaxID=2975865 RepID=UPI00224C84C5|nr:anti-sigma factor [Streptomyces sp. NBC_01142]MCX4821897.1 anti-sigma factor [Streptomyces sp. NBC_01142]